MIIYLILIIYLLARTIEASHGMIARNPQESPSTASSNATPANSTPTTQPPPLGSTVSTSSAAGLSGTTSTTPSQSSVTSIATAITTPSQLLSPSSSTNSTNSLSIVSTTSSGDISSATSSAMSSTGNVSTSTVPALLTTATQPNNSTITPILSTSTPIGTSKPKLDSHTGVAIGIPILVIALIIIAVAAGLHFCIHSKKKLGPFTIGGGNPLRRTKGYSSGRSRSRMMRTAGISRPMQLEEAFSDAPDADEWELAETNGGRGAEADDLARGRPYDDSPAGTPRFDNSHANPFRD